MTSAELDNLVRIGKLKHEPPSVRELQGLLASARERLADAERTTLAFASRFDLAYNASHALALHALRHAGFRCDARYLAFQALPHTLGMPAEVWRRLPRHTSGAISPSTRAIWSTMSGCSPTCWRLRAACWRRSKHFPNRVQRLDEGHLGRAVGRALPPGPGGDPGGAGGGVAAVLIPGPARRRGAAVIGLRRDRHPCQAPHYPGNVSPWPRPAN